MMRNRLFLFSWKIVKTALLAFALFASVLLLPTIGRAGASFTDPQLSVKLIAEQSSIASGAPFTAGLDFTLKPGILPLSRRFSSRLIEVL